MPPPSSGIGAPGGAPAQAYEHQLNERLEELRVDTINYLVLARWPPGTPTRHAPRVIQQTLDSSFTTFHALYHVYQGPSERRIFIARDDMSGGNCMAFCIAAVSYVDESLQGEIERMFAGGTSALCRYEVSQNGKHYRASSAVAWRRAEQLQFPQDPYLTLDEFAELQHPAVPALLDALADCVWSLHREHLNGGNKAIRRRLNWVSTRLQEIILRRSMPAQIRSLPAPQGAMTHGEPACTEQGAGEPACTVAVHGAEALLSAESYPPENTMHMGVSRRGPLLAFGADCGSRSRSASRSRSRSPRLRR